MSNSIVWTVWICLASRLPGENRAEGLPVDVVEPFFADSAEPHVLSGSHKLHAAQ
jgi:hypothetical protein